MVEAAGQVGAGQRVQKLAWLLVPCALLLIPFVNFAKSNAYPVLAPEMLLAAAGFSIFGLLLGALAQVHRAVRALIIAGALTMLIDVQTQIFFAYSLRHYVWLPIGLWALAFVVPRTVEPAVLALIYTMLLAVLVRPTSSPLGVGDTAAGSRNMTAPLATKPDTYWVHIVVDEHIGIESIPGEFDPNHRIARQIRNDYLNDGFTVFGRAFTSFSQTHLSLPNILNFSVQHPVSFAARDSGPGGRSREVGKYLTGLRSRGFNIHVYDTDYLPICDFNGNSGATACNRYRGNALWGLFETSLSTTDKALAILGQYARLSKIYVRVKDKLAPERRMPFPQSISPLVGLKVASMFKEDILVAQPGSAWLLHLLLPHDPYALDERCSIRDLPWRENGHDSDTFEMNSERERRSSYPLYLQQVQCVHGLLQELFESLKEAGIFDRAHIVVHGDHGSRIATHNLRERPLYPREFIPSQQTLIDYYATLFAYKAPAQKTGQYRRDMLSAESLLERVFSGDLDTGALDDLEPTVYLVEWDDHCQDDRDVGAEGCRLLPIRLPSFSEGETSDSRDHADRDTNGS